MNQTTSPFTFRADGGLEITVGGAHFSQTAESAQAARAFTVQTAETRRLGHPALRLTYHAEPTGEWDTLPAIAFEPDPADLQILPYFQGIVYTADEEDILPVLELNLFSAWMSMSFWATVKSDGAWLLCAVHSNCDARLTFPRENGLQRTQLNWLPECGKWGYDRVLELVVGASGGVTALCKAYRDIAREKGLLCTFADKAAANPAVRSYIGRANVWLWNNDAMDKLYSADAQLRIPTPDQLALRREIAADMKASGMDHVLWSVFDENVDPETVHAVRDMGYMTTFYDVYTDVIPAPIAEKIPATRRKRCEPRMAWWPKGIQVERNGSLTNAWPLKGIDGVFYNQNRMCDCCAPECAMQYAVPHMEQTGLDGRFIDVAFMNAFECYSAAHPMTRRKSLAEKQRLMRVLHDRGWITGTEVGREECVPVCEYDEGMLSPAQWRAPEAGRRMTHIYEGDEIPPKIPEKMLCAMRRVPLWELVFHDCMTSYWYWGDSSACCPALTPVRDQFDALYGLPPIYSFRAADWPRLKPVITESYRRTVPLARAVGGVEMTDFQWLNAERTVQKTVFANGITVVANFSDRPSVFEKEIIAPGGVWYGKTEENQN